MSVQTTMIDRLRGLCQQDQRLMAATLYGSFTVGEGDAYSDIECVLFFEPAHLATLDKRAWVEQIAPVYRFFADDFGHYTAIFEHLIRGEFHFDSTDDLAKVATWKGSAWFPSAASCILVDRKGDLERLMQPLFGAPPERDTAETAAHLLDSFTNLMLFGSNVLARGELARSHEILQLVHRTLLWMARLVEHTTAHWPTPSKGLEKDLSTASYRRFAACTAALDPDAIRDAYRASWQWGQDLSAILMERHHLPLPVDLLAAVDQRFFSGSAG